MEMDEPQQPRRLTDPEVVPGVWGVLETPATTGSGAGVLLLPGSDGWRPHYAKIARAFADAGFVSLALDYYAETGPSSSKDDRQRMWPLWKATVRNAVAYLRSLSSVLVRTIGLVGYSRGAFLAVAVAASLPEVRAVVDFFGGGTPDEDLRGFPPLLILHGEADTDVPVEHAHRLRDAVRTHGVEVEMYLYPGAGHGFNAPWAPAYSEPEATDSWDRTIEFLRRRLT